jgi:hypothetical protein
MIKYCRSVLIIAAAADSYCYYYPKKQRTVFIQNHKIFRREWGRKAPPFPKKPLESKQNPQVDPVGVGIKRLFHIIRISKLVIIIIAVHQG